MMDEQEQPSPGEIAEEFDGDPEESFNNTMIGLYKITRNIPESNANREIVIDAAKHLWDLRQRYANLLRKL